MSNPSEYSDVPSDPVQRNEWIKFQLRMRGTSMSDLARRLGVTRQAVRNALTAPYPKMERIIARELDLEPEAIWPERYRYRRQMANQEQD
jgi:Ner family transcriptional regulator